MRSVAIALDGVLRKDADTEAQDMGGTLLYRSLLSQFRVVILGTARDISRDEQFLMLNGIRDYVKIEPTFREDGDTPHSILDGQLRRLRNEGFRFEFLVLPSAYEARYYFLKGQPVLLYAHPQYSPAMFSAQEQTSWRELSREIKIRHIARAKEQVS